MLFTNLSYNINRVTKQENKVTDFKIIEEILPDKLTPNERLNYNIEAISMLNRVEKGTRELDNLAQEVLARYVFRCI